MESQPRPGPAAARAALTELDAAREAVARRVTAPWWYRVGVALSTASLFVGMGVLVGRPAPGGGAEAGSSLLIALGACVAPVVLVWALRRSSGVSIDRYSRGMTRWYVEMFLLLGIAFVLQAFLQVPYALAATGAVAFLLTLAHEHRIDAALRERVRVGT